MKLRGHFLVAGTVLLGLGLSANSFAEQANEIKLPQGKSVQKPDEGKGKIKTYSVQHFPNFNTEGLFTEFRYVNHTLKYIYFWNTSDNAIELSAHGHTRVLGPNDDLSVKAPNLDEFSVNVRPHMPNTSAMMKQINVGHTYLYSKKEDGYYQIHSGNIDEVHQFNDDPSVYQKNNSNTTETKKN
ncbi:MAG: hypothetical protein ACX932_07400 [Gammaproteobacteria bacterium]